ncbi:hypothetical protein SSX86_029731 [Deinandra increscens subsp. villosa]|uniref:SHSP domain-containing protein n=1 Tax=Deinandra increscens subsp. villosa TaxID=3103831 RepID=A0AAP0GKU0_9ASTR
MASSMRLITSNLLPFRYRSPAVLASRFFSTDRHIARSSYTTMPTDDSNDHAWLRIPCPKLSSLSFDMNNYGGGRCLDLKIPNEGMRVAVEKPGIEKKGINTFLIHGKTHSERFLEGIDKDDHSITKFIVDDIITSKRLCPIIAMLPVINSFSIYKEVDCSYLRITMDMPGKDIKMKLTSQGLRVMLDMDGVDRKDVKVFFDYDTLFIEGKTKREHYITGIQLPKGIHKKHNMIKRKMKDGVLYATFPCCVKEEELPQIKDQMKLMKDHMKLKDQMKLDSISRSKKKQRWHHFSHL